MNAKLILLALALCVAMTGLAIAEPVTTTDFQGDVTVQKVGDTTKETRTGKWQYGGAGVLEGEAVIAVAGSNYNLSKHGKLATASFRGELVLDESVEGISTLRKEVLTGREILVDGAVFEGTATKDTQVKGDNKKYRLAKRGKLNSVVFQGELALDETVDPRNSVRKEVLTGTWRVSPGLTLQGEMITTTKNGVVTVTDNRKQVTLPPGDVLPKPFEAGGVVEPLGSGIVAPENPTITAVAAKLGMKTQPPVTVKINTVISPAPQINILDASGSVVTTDNSTQVTASCANLIGTTTVTAVNGVVTFSNLKFSNNRSQMFENLTFSASGLTGVISGNMMVYGVAHHLNITQQPGGGAPGSVWPAQPTLFVVDQNNHAVVDNSSTVVTAAIGSNPGAGTLSGTKVLTANQGMVIYSNLSINNAGTGYTLNFASVFPTVSSGQFNISANATPIISGITPAQGQYRNSGIHITGFNFGALRGVGYVSFLGTQATAYGSWSATGIDVTVPADAPLGTIPIQVRNNNNVLGDAFYYPVFAAPPAITGFNPAQGARLEVYINIAGNNFGASRGSGSVTFGGVPASAYNSWNNNSVYAKVPAAAPVGGVQVIVTTNDGVASTPANYTIFGTPVITGIYPPQGRYSNEIVTIDGTNFMNPRGSGTVKFGGIPATTYDQWTRTWINVRVPANAPIGSSIPVIVTNDAGIASTSVNYRVLATPVIIGLTPTLGQSRNAGVFVNGNNFGDLRGAGKVTFGGVVATTYGTWSKTNIQVTVPANAPLGSNPVIVTNDCNLSSTPVNYMVLAPAITGIAPATGAPRSTNIIVTGSNFGATRGIGTVKFGGVDAAAYGTWSNTQIQVTVPATAPLGNCPVIVTDNLGGSSSAVNYTVTNNNPSVTFLSVYAGPVGSSVQINGANFGAWKGACAVKFGTTAAATTSWANDQIVATVPSLAVASYPITVVTGKGTSNSLPLFICTTPYIYSIIPTQGYLNQEIDLIGGNFGTSQGFIMVDAGGPEAFSATVVSWSNGAIRFRLGYDMNATINFNIKVLRLDNAFSNTVSYRYLEPLINTFIPIQGKAGTDVTMNGDYFGSTQGTGTVKFDGMAVTVTSWSNTQIHFTVPALAYGNHLVTVSKDGSTSVPKNFRITRY